jgi:predicted nucleic acid-binding protein
MVVDASVALAWCFPDEAGDYADSVLSAAQGEKLHVPAIWPIEIANALWVGERRQRIRAADIHHFAALLAGLEMVEDLQRLPLAVSHILPLAREHAISAYDAAYLELAIRRQAKLATLDEALRKAARLKGISIVAI